MDTARNSHSDSNPEDALATDTRRRAERRETTARLLVVIETPQFNGHADNLSEHGVFFSTNERVRVQVHVDEDGEQKCYLGKIVRVQQMNAQETGFAIEFDAR
jgi:hypothetical protein